MPSVNTILEIARISEYLARIDVAKGSLFGQRIAPSTPYTIYMERKAVQWMYDLDPTNSTLTLTANYLYSLCRGYNLKANNILNGGSGGSISPISPSNPAPAPYQFIVAASGTLLIDGQSSQIISSYIGYNLLFSRGGVPQSTINTESTYYTWDKTSGLFTVSPAASTGELFQLYAI